MPIISTIGRRSLKTRALVYTIYALLITGSITMVYPFLLMVAGSSKSNTDRNEMRLVPTFLVDDECLWIKHIEGLFNESVGIMREAYNLDAPAFDYIDIETMEARRDRAKSTLSNAEAELAEFRAKGLSDEKLADAAKQVTTARQRVEGEAWSRKIRLGRPKNVNTKMVELWREFLTKKPQPHYAYAVGYLLANRSLGVMPKALREFKDELSAKYDGDISKLNADLGTQYESWWRMSISPDEYLMRQERVGTTKFDMVRREFKKRQPLENRYYFSPEGAYKEIFLKPRFSRRIKSYNEEYGTNYTSFDQIHLYRSLAEAPSLTPQEREDWISFVRKDLNVLWVRAAGEAVDDYRSFLKAKYVDVATLNRAHKTSYVSFESIPMAVEPPTEGRALSDWQAFLEGWKDEETQKVYKLADKDLRVHSTNYLFRDFLSERYESIDKLNAEVGTQFGNWLEVLPPQEGLHYLAFEKQKDAIRWEFIKRNYITVVDYIVLHGRGILNTVIYCTLAVLAALLVNPLAAYALSRYKPPSSYKILLFLMLTMAFPPMVTQIPVFLMLRKFELLNTFWALILPGLAHGYSIFLLKGFFDSLPQELYESAELDGAGEFRIFWQITMSLSKPILAVIALGTFTAAYANFMMALLICQDQKMWTLMVWLYQLQGRSGPGVTYAALLIAAVPTFLIFVFCQKIIMRGIVVPVEK